MKKKWMIIPIVSATLAFLYGGLEAKAYYQNGWVEADGKPYWYENGVRQGTEGRGKEIYDPDSNAWYWLDAVDDGKKAVSKDVYQESEAGSWADREDGTGKWVRYDEEGHMIKGWYTDENGTYYFDRTYGTMAKGTCIIGGMEIRFDEFTGVMLPGQERPLEGWVQIDGADYWYEDGVRQGYRPDDPTYRGKEIYDPDSNAWYWLDNVQQGAKAVSKDVYQDSYAGNFADNPDGTGKWVRYDENGHMIKGWDMVIGDNPTKDATYYFDEETGAMLKGTHTISGSWVCVFDEVTGKLRSLNGSSVEEAIDWIKSGMDNSFGGMVYDDAIEYYAPVFYDEYYFFTNKEVGESIDPYEEPWYEASLRHFANEGIMQGKKSTVWFDVDSYLNNYPELEEQFGDNVKAYYTHYIDNGIAEGKWGAGNKEERYRIGDVYFNNRYYVSIVFDENKFLENADGVYVTDGVSKYPVNISLHKMERTIETTDYRRYDIISESEQIPAGFTGELVVEEGTLKGADGSIVSEIRYPVVIENYVDTSTVEITKETFGEQEYDFMSQSELFSLSNGKVRLFRSFDNRLYVMDIAVDGTVEKKLLAEIEEFDIYGMAACQIKNGDFVIRLRGREYRFYRYKADGTVEYIGERSDVYSETPMYAVGDIVVMDYRNSSGEEEYFFKILPDNSMVRSKGYDRETEISYDFSKACYLEDGSIVDIADMLEAYHFVFNENFEIIDRIPNEFSQEKNHNLPEHLPLGYDGYTYDISRTASGYQFWETAVLSGYECPQIRTRQIDSYGINISIHQMDGYCAMDYEVPFGSGFTKYKSYDVDVMEDGKAVLLKSQRRKDFNEPFPGAVSYTEEEYGNIRFYDNEDNYLTSYECGEVEDVEQTSNGDVMLLTEESVKILKGVLR